MRKIPLTWKKEQNESEIQVRLSGILNEDFDFKGLVAAIGEVKNKLLILNLSEITRVNSMGIREWFNFLRILNWPSKIQIEESSVAFTHSVCQIEELARGCIFISARSSAWCSKCEEDIEVLLNFRGSDCKMTKLCEKDVNCPAECDEDAGILQEIVKKQLR